MTPYYSDDLVTIYHGDAEELAPAFDWCPELVITDPPYPDFHVDTYRQTGIGLLDLWPCRQFIFWSARAEFPLDWTGLHIWDKRIGIDSQYERIFERNGRTAFRVFRHSLINSPVTAAFVRDVYTGHPSQKPVELLTELMVGNRGPVFDPFMGSGSTLVAAKRLSLPVVGIEIEERYCEIAATRCSQEVLGLPA